MNSDQEEAFKNYQFNAPGLVDGTAS
jgi:hypothetical protein